MFGKVVQLLGNPLENGFEVTYGIDDVDFKQGFRYALSFGDIIFVSADSDITKTYINCGYAVEEKADGFKDIFVFNGELSDEDDEDFLLVIIPYAAWLKTNSKKIAGRYSDEAILEMRAGDTLEVSKSSIGKRDVYMAVKAGNELFLIKKSR